MVTWALLLALGAGDSDFECSWARDRWAKVGLKAPCKVLTGATPAAQLAAAQQEWKLTAAQAQCALEAAAQPGDGRDQLPAHLAWRRCVEQWPEQPMFWNATLLTWNQRAELTTLLAKLPPAPADGGRSLADQLLDVEYGPDALLAASILRGDRSRLSTLLSDTRISEVARFELARSTLESRQPTAAEWDALLQPLLMTPLSSGHWLTAAELWLRLPGPLRAKAAASVEFAPFETPYNGSARPMLALGLIALGQQAEAKKLVIPPPRKDARRNEALIAQAVAWHLTGERAETPWDAAISARTSNDLGPWEAWLALMPYLHPHEALFAERFARVERYEREHPERQEEVYAAWSARALALLKQQMSFAAPPGIDAGVASLPDALPSPFVERTVPWKGPAPKTIDPRSAGAPTRYRPVRAQKQGKRTVVLATSQRFDPVGEVSPGGYWLLISNGTGAWQELYLGLGDHRPFHALKQSTVPLLDAQDVVRVAMEDAPINEKSIMFPPIATSAPTRRELVVLEAPLTALAKDSDGDGLSDLVEARLLLDPTKKDTDGDGVIDGDDPTPRLDDRLPATPLAEVYNAFFEDFLTGRKQPRALIVAPGADPLAATFRAADLEDVRFLRGEAAALGGLRPLVRIITLSAAELEAARARFGAFYPMGIEVSLNGADHAFIEWSEGWRGGSCRVNRDVRGVLVVTHLSSWIS